MDNKRIKRLNSLLKQVLSEVIHKDVKDPRIHSLFSITSVDISNDLQHAKVHVSIIGSPKEKEQTIEALQSAAAFIAVTASKKVVMRYFPTLAFKLDESVEKQMRIDTVLKQIHEEQKSRKPVQDSQS